MGVYCSVDLLKMMHKYGKNECKVYIYDGEQICDSLDCNYPAEWVLSYQVEVSYKPKDRNGTA